MHGAVTEVIAAALQDEVIAAALQRGQSAYIALATSLEPNKAEVIMYGEVAVQQESSADGGEESIRTITFLDGKKLTLSSNSVSGEDYVGPLGGLDSQYRGQRMIDHTWFPVASGDIDRKLLEFKRTEFQVAGALNKWNAKYVAQFNRYLKNVTESAAGGSNRRGPA